MLKFYNLPNSHPFSFSASHIVRSLCLPVLAWLMFSAGHLAAQNSFSITYTDGNLPVWNEWQPAADSAISPCAGKILVNIPQGMWIDSVDVSYEITSLSGSVLQSDQRSRLISPGTGTGEDDYFASPVNSPGTYAYSRTGLTQFTGLTGNVDFYLDVKRHTTSSNANGWCGYSQMVVNNNTWTITVHLSGAVQCEVPYNISFPSVSGYNAIMTWQGTVPGVSWELGLDTTGLGVSSLYGITAASAYHEITGLVPESEYHVFIRSVCNNQVYSEWYGPFSFTTFPENIMQLSHTHDPIPSSYEFPVNTQNISPCAGSLVVKIPDGFWITEVDVEYTITSTGGAFVGEQRSRLMAPEYGLGEENYFHIIGALGGIVSYQREGLEMFYGITGEVEFQLDVKRIFGVPSPEVCDIYWVYVNPGTWNLTLYIDSVSSCLEPLHLNVSANTDSSALLQWTSLGNTESWELEYGPAGFTPSGNPDITGITDVPYLLTGLSPFTNYDVYLRANCGPLGYSDWSGPVTVITLCKTPGLSTTGDTICGTAQAMLIAQSNSPGATLVWYDAPAGGSIAGYGDTLITPPLNSNTTFWVKAYTDTTTYQTGAPNPFIGSMSVFQNVTANGLLFESMQPVHLESVTIYPTGSGLSEIEIRAYPGNELIFSKTFTVNGDSVTPFIADLNVDLEPGSYRIGRGSASDVQLVHHHSGGQYPYQIENILSIYASTGNLNQYFFFYDWKVQLRCIAERVPVEVTANSGLSLGIPENHSICEGDTLYLQVPDGFSFHAWMIETASGTNFTTTPSIAVTEPGTYTLTAYDFDNCSATVSSAISVNQPPEIDIIATPSQVCTGDSISLSVSVSADSLIWSSNIDVQQPFVVEENMSFSVTGFLGGCSNTATILITPLPLPEVIFETDSLICNNTEPFELTGGFPAGGQYEGPGVDNNVFNPAEAGTGTFTLAYIFQDDFGCSGTAMADITVEVCDAVNDVIGSEYLVYPNPFRNYMTVNLETIAGEVEVIRLTDLTGRSLLQVTSSLVQQGGQSYRLNLEWLPAGMYYLVIESSHGVYSKAVTRVD